ncbi:MAG: exodeoxyribonuclease VII small subunit [Candidatus Kuenenia stuttgartiensis]|uniref:Exodeoxyribonuclease 7 small subunit n=1 Tax=Kuenenia stuttgartiensis TaxID=174633 RepID=Q1PV40_KUEST|nr:MULTISPECIES: exodeoxyribonuclease VII small subunit [Kuenenia]MBZ0193048.1 exodeoxyribonuclease VII small subunit [Candidatus Kuenenia stuttgartiensis]MCF6152418.1 exodeoxyribonuclease VII small subunit [Candidatus Kuenenia stuttgartiensis]MCL4726602.1 exodeoxyribonuclease VII small subunit [Candidatus Kuenenia stuttgartiensis]MCZ7621483.1 exodeoxyribonuclease VII small subunit [Candidatus Kuenenia sp.]TVM01418.1 MAG: exodeoxyribonuclease VII small subunit [Candidatus Kuenenia stuttgartien
MAKVKFEEALKGLEKIVDKLEKGDMPLDETLSEYENGIKLYKKCVSMLDEAEKKIQILVKDENGSFSTRDFIDNSTNDTNNAP